MNSFKDTTGTGLEWESEPPATSVNFLDLTLLIHPWKQNKIGQCITTKTFQKEMNLHLHRLPTSSQPPEMLKGMIRSTLHRCLSQNACTKDFLKIAIKFLFNLERRGHQTLKLHKMFLDCLKKLSNSQLPNPNDPKNAKRSSQSNEKHCFLHLTFHSSAPSQKQIQNTFQNALAPTSQACKLPLSQMTIAFAGGPTTGSTVKSNCIRPTEDTTPFDNLGTS